MKQAGLLVGLSIAAQSGIAQAINESARNIPLAFDVDVVVIGGTSRGVAAAVAAAENGASVFLAAPRPYLGEDICGTFRLFLKEDEIPDSNLAKSMFSPAGGPGTSDTEASMDRVNGFRTTTPMQVKKSLDKALLDKGVAFLYSSIVTDLLVDPDGQLCGIVMANRSGRQAVRAKVIIDATDRALAARIAGAEFAPWPKGPQPFLRRVLGGQPGENANDSGVVLTVGSDRMEPRNDAEKELDNYTLYEYHLEIPMADGSWASFAEAEMQARNLTWQDGQAAASEFLFQVPPDPLKSRAGQIGPWPGSKAINLDALRPADLDRLYTLGGCADLSREAAEVLMRPLEGMRLGQRVGVAAANEAKAISLPPIDDLSVMSIPTVSGPAVEIGEMLNGLRSEPEPDLQFISSPDRQLPILGKYDVVVIGGGTGGAPAGIGAGRAGARTLVVEYLHGLGGVGTLGRISSYWFGNRVGFTAEIDEAMGATSKWNIEKRMEWYRSELDKVDCDVWFQTMGIGSVVRDNRFIGAVVATPHGRGVVLANTVIDSTGNAVLPACAGAETMTIDAEHISVQGTGLPPMSPGKSYMNSDWTFSDDDDALDMWRMFLVGKKKYRDLFDLGQLIDTRARRRVVGDLVIMPMDIYNNRTYPDTVNIAMSNFDNHGFSSHSLFMIVPPSHDKLQAAVPFRALTPKGLDGILVTGLGISAHGDAMPVLRMQPDVQNQGYAAGKAAAMAAEAGTTVRHIDIKQLQQHLVEQEILPEHVLTDVDSYPIPEAQLKQAVQRIGEDYDGINLVLTQPERAIPLLQDAWSTESDPDRKIRYAHVLGMLYDGTGAPTLIDAIQSATWDKGWNFRGMGQFGATTSPLDNLIIALGRTRVAEGFPVIVQKARELTRDSEFSHYRAVSIAFESYDDPKAAPVLADLLRQPGVTGHALTEIIDTMERSPDNINDVSLRQASLRELILARALYRCGDDDSLGEQILEAYARDYRGLYSKHAKAVLKEGM